MESSWKYVKPLINQNAVKEYIRKYRIELPQDIVEILQKYNGGRPADKRILTSTKREYVFKTLLSYNVGDKETIYNVYPEPFRKLGLYPIASDAAGNYICFDLVNKGWVLYNHETDRVERIIEISLIR